jgi:HEAT repeat protein
MDGRTAAAFACVGVGFLFLLVCGGILGRRLRLERRRRGSPLQLPPVLDVHRAPWADLEEWRDGLAVARELEEAAARGGPDAQVSLREALWSRDPVVRQAAVAALGRLGERHDWAIDGLVEALAEHRDAPASVAAQLDRLAPRVGLRLAPLLRHPRSVVRFYAVRLLRPYGSLARDLVPDLVDDPSPNVRAAALETLASAPSGNALRRALDQLDDPHPLVRAQACRTSAAVSARAAAPFVAPLLADASWWVREAAREALVAGGRGVTDVVVPVLADPDPNVRLGAALVLQDVGVVDDLVADGDDPVLLGTIFEAGGGGIRTAAAERARRGQRLGRPTLVAEAGG